MNFNDILSSSSSESDPETDWYDNDDYNSFFRVKNDSENTTGSQLEKNDTDNDESSLLSANETINDLKIENKLEDINSPDEAHFANLCFPVLSTNSEKKNFKIDDTVENKSDFFDLSEISSSNSEVAREFCKLIKFPTANGNVKFFNYLVNGTELDKGQIEWLKKHGKTKNEIEETQESDNWIETNSPIMINSNSEIVELIEALTGFIILIFIFYYFIQNAIFQ